MSGSKFVGVDWCGGGWLSVGLSEDHEPELKLFGSTKSGPTAFKNLLDHYQAAELILVDIPIGLPAGKKGVQIGRNDGEIGGRYCDWEAREMLGRRKNSVFPTPTRSTVYKAKAAKRKDAYKVACDNELNTSGAKLEKTSFNLVDQIHQVDMLQPLSNPKVREVHPEICFWAFNGKKPMQYWKLNAKGKGIAERIDVLNKTYCRTDQIIEASYAEVFRKHFGSDDVLDALAAAVTAYKVSLNPEQLRTLPANTPPDAQGSMEMVYWVPPRKG